MALIHVVERPGDPEFENRRSGVAGVASLASHAAVVIVVVMAFQLAPGSREPAQPSASPIANLIWIPSVEAAGGGTSGGGNHATAPPRRAERPGEDAQTVRAEAAPSNDPANDVPIDVTPLPAQPLAHGSQELPGVIDSQGASASLGPGPTGAGQQAAPGDGLGNVPGNGVGNEPYGLGSGVTTPVPIRQAKPQYTADAMRAKVQGTVWLECVVLPDGSVTGVKVIRSLDPVFGLDQEAIAAAKQWRFRPGQMHGRPVAVIVTIELAFTLR